MIRIPTGDLVGVVSDVLPFAFPKDDFPEINAVGLDWDGDKLHAYATDYQRSAWSSWAPGDLGGDIEIQDDLFENWGGDDDPWSIVVTRADAAKLVQVFRLPDKHWGCPLHIAHDGRKDCLVVSRDRSTGFAELELSAQRGTDRFVNVRRVLDGLGMRQDVEAVSAITFSAKSLADFAKVRPIGPMRMAFAGESGAVLVRIGARFVGAILPSRMVDIEGRVID